MNGRGWHADKLMMEKTKTNDDFSSSGGFDRLTGVWFVNQKQNLCIHSYKQIRGQVNDDDDECQQAGRSSIWKKSIGPEFLQIDGESSSRWRWVGNGRNDQPKLHEIITMITNTDWLENRCRRRRIQNIFAEEEWKHTDTTRLKEGKKKHWLWW